MDPSVYRILDANLNRAREGLRVIEEFLRFVREDRRGAWYVKRWRHQLRSIVDRLGPERLLAARAAVSDVGKDLASPSNGCKQDPAAITAAGFKRLQEALRVIEEYAAAVDPEANKTAGAMRFEVYQFEKEFFLAGPRTRIEAVRLYLLIGSDCCPPEQMVRTAREVLAVGVDCIQLREKTLPDRQAVRLAESLAAACHDAGKLFIVNDRADIARAVGADGVHVGQDDLPVSAVRQILGPDKIIGVSTHRPDQLRAAIEADPTYIAVGPAFATATKPHEPAAGVGYVSEAIAALREAGIPEVAIGGITSDNLSQVTATGVRRIAVCSAILAAADKIAAAETLVRRLTGP